MEETYLPTFAARLLLTPSVAATELRWSIPLFSPPASITPFLASQHLLHKEDVGRREFYFGTLVKKSNHISSQSVEVHAIKRTWAKERGDLNNPSHSMGC